MNENYLKYMDIGSSYENNSVHIKKLKEKSDQLMINTKTANYESDSEEEMNLKTIIMIILIIIVCMIVLILLIYLLRAFNKCRNDTMNVCNKYKERCEEYK